MPKMPVTSSLVLFPADPITGKDGSKNSIAGLPPQLPFELSSDNFISSKLIIQSTSKHTSDPVTPTSASVFHHPNPSSTIKFSQLSNHMERF
jgi:hypothetical protein